MNVKTYLIYAEHMDNTSLGYSDDVKRVLAAEFCEGFDGKRMCRSARVFQGRGSMIDEDRTMQLFGYNSSDLGSMSHKEVVIVCEECGKYMVSKPCIYNRRKLDGHLCISCSNRTDEKRDTMRTIALGRRHTKDELVKMSVSQLGEKNHNWKGGITSWRSKMWFSHVYKNWRQLVFERDDYTCKICGERGGNLEAHHIHPIRYNRNNLSVYDVDNGITLCNKCHASINNGRDIEYINMFENIINGGGN